MLSRVSPLAAGLAAPDELAAGFAAAETLAGAAAGAELAGGADAAPPHPLANAASPISPASLPIEPICRMVAPSARVSGIVGRLAVPDLRYDGQPSGSKVALVSWWPPLVSS